MGFKKEDAFQCALCMHLTASKFHYAVVNVANKKIVYSSSFKVEDFSKNGIKPFLDEPVFSYDFQHFSIAAGTWRNTMIPVDLFTYSKPEDVFKLNYPAPFENLDYNRIPELGIVNIYEFPLWIKSLFVVRFPRIKLIHPSTVFLKGVFDGAVFEAKAHLYIEKDRFYLVLTHKSKLLYFNYFDYKELSDIIYFIHFVFEQKELNRSEYKFYLYGKKDKWSGIEELEKQLNVKIIVSERPEQGKSFLLNKQLLCV